MSDIQKVELPERVIDKLFQAAGVSTCGPDGEDILEKLHAFARNVVAETLARLSVPNFPAATEAHARVKAFLDVWATRRTNDPEIIHGLDNDKELRTSDLRALLAPLDGAINTHELRQSIGEKLTDKLGEMIGTEGPMDPYDSRDVDMLLDAFMPTIEGLTVTRTAYDELVADRDRLLVELQRRRDVERGNVWHWQTDGGNALESLACPVIIHAAALRELLPQWNTGTPPTKENDYDEYIVAVRRAHDKRKVFVFAANYANKFVKDELHDQDGNEYVPDGWYDMGHDMSGEFDALWQPMLGEGDEVVGWQHKPKWVNS